ncbi:hypothetical protein [Fulvivirga sediminis]|uniref:Uncharacterized protein n=1 Tax=Fulvivirga sediminis TaxID=2803949 RepID=A0A937FEK3_9BACT|nr:hypothetical protein [Fulvivirga sediminis]MBL3658953.1 hypothetical protein [Fulvivirga sediminis]
MGRQIAAFGFISPLPFIIIFTGLSLLPLASGPFRKFIYQRKKWSKRLEVLKDTLGVYDYYYDDRITLTQGLHNILAVEVHIIVYLKGSRIME